MQLNDMLTAVKAYAHCYISSIRADCLTVHFHDSIFVGAIFDWPYVSLKWLKALPSRSSISSTTAYACAATLPRTPHTCAAVFRQALQWSTTATMISRVRHEGVAVGPELLARLCLASDAQLRILLPDDAVACEVALQHVTGSATVSAVSHALSDALYDACSHMCLPFVENAWYLYVSSAAAMREMLVRALHAIGTTHVAVVMCFEDALTADAIPARLRFLSEPCFSAC